MNEVVIIKYKICLQGSECGKKPYFSNSKCLTGNRITLSLIDGPIKSGVNHSTWITYSLKVLYNICHYKTTCLNVSESEALQNL